MWGCCHFRHSRTCRSSDPGQPDPGPFQAGHGAQCGLCRKASPGLLTHCVLSFPEPGPLPLPLRVSGFRTSLPRVLGLRPPGSFPGPAWSPRSAQGIHERKPRPFAGTLRPSVVPNLDPEGTEQTSRGQEGQRGTRSPGHSERVGEGAGPVSSSPPPLTPPVSEKENLLGSFN